MRLKIPFRNVRRFTTHAQKERETSTDLGDSEQEPAEEPPVSRKQLIQAFKCAAVPMVAFGFMDNTIMIYAGDYIDNSIGFTFGLATLVAASFGQCLSDTSGVLSGSTIETIAGNKLKPPEVTIGQRMSTRFRVVTTAGAMLGVIFGCCLGLVNLLFIDLERKERREKQRELDGIFDLVMGKGPEVFECEAASLFVFDPDRRVLWTKVSSTGHMIEVPEDKPSVVTHVYKTGEIIEIKDEFDPRVYREGAAGFVTRTMLAAPVYMEDKCVAVIEIMNKVSSPHFTEDDLHMLKVLANHVGLFCKSFSFEECARDMEDKSRFSLLRNYFSGWAYTT